MTGRDTHPDIDFIMQVDDPKSIENCVKGLIKKNMYKKNKELYRMNLDATKDVIFNCAIIDARISEINKDNVNTYILFDSSVIDHDKLMLDKQTLKPVKVMSKKPSKKLVQVTSKKSSKNMVKKPSKKPIKVTSKNMAKKPSKKPINATSKKPSKISTKPKKLLNALLRRQSKKQDNK